MKILTLGALVLGVLLTACGHEPGPISQTRSTDAAGGETRLTSAGNTPGTPRIVRSEEEWKATLTPEQYRVLREKGTERPFTGKYWNTYGAGAYCCAGCGEELFGSDQKFDAGCGWPSFSKPVAKGKLVEQKDTSLPAVRTEVACAACGGHLGHVFTDGPGRTGLRYCINSASLDFQEKGVLSADAPTDSKK